jgi:hypothetical protein
MQYCILACSPETRCTRAPREGSGRCVPQLWVAQFADPSLPTPRVPFHVLPGCHSTIARGTWAAERKCGLLANVRCVLLPYLDGCMGGLAG